jgi:glycosyltransferase involved in cell wall biosynthesis
MLLGVRTACTVRTSSPECRALPSELRRVLISQKAHPSRHGTCNRRSRTIARLPGGRPTQKVTSVDTSYDVVCLSHLRWSFVFQRPQHLLSRCALERRVYFVEEPIFGAGRARLLVTRSEEGVYVLVPHLEDGVADAELEQAAMLRDFLRSEHVLDYVLWYYTPMALPLAAELTPCAVIYDCMDQLCAFKNAPACLVERERELLATADLVFTGGHALFEAKKDLHSNIHAFPSSVDISHFAKARSIREEPADQRSILGPRLGFFGVVDERMDLRLLAGVAAARPDWQLVILGPVVKIDEADLPRAPNIHYLGGKSYAQLPEYIAGWDVALLPFARNESTEFISPTKTPEYLAAGKPVVSTSIRDVVRPYQGLGLVRIADTVLDFVAACEAAMEEPEGVRLLKADAFLSHQSWDKTWRQMRERIDAAVRKGRDTSSVGLNAASGADSESQSAVAGGE